MTTAPGSATDAPAIPPVFDILPQELEDFRTEARAFLDGQRDEAKFIGFRLKQGVYGQRQPDRQMNRVKLPFGRITAEQLRAFAEVTERFAPLRKGHITTRQAIQIHHMPLADMYEVLSILGRAGLTSREACGNTVRNVTGDPWAGISPGEPFDVTPYAGAFARYWLRNEISQLLPRKFKVSFSGTEEDRAMAPIHDIGFVAQVRRGDDGREVRGFRMVVGGGLSTMPREAIVLHDFIPVDEYLRVSEAVVRIFNQADELRKNILKARLKFLVARVGAEEFGRMVEAELRQPWAREPIRPDDLLYHDDEAADAPAPPAAPAPPSTAEGPAFARWAESNVRAQRQPGYVAVEVQVPQGDLTPEQFRGLAAILERHGNRRARTTPWQNLVLRWIPEAAAPAVWRDLRALGLAGAGAQEITDVVSCPGTDSCKLGITSSMGLNRAVTERLVEMDITDPLTRQIQVNASGCPNSCGQHHIANIGFHGAAMKSGERQLPAYHVFVGGHRRSGSALRMSTLLRVRVPAKRTPDVVERFVRLYEADRHAGEAFNDFFDRVGAQPFEDAIRDLSLAPEFSMDTMPAFIDWERDGLYVLERGEGECAV